MWFLYLFVQMEFAIWQSITKWDFFHIYVYEAVIVSSVKHEDTSAFLEELYLETNLIRTKSISNMIPTYTVITICYIDTYTIHSNMRAASYTINKKFVMIGYDIIVCIRKKKLTSMFVFLISSESSLQYNSNDKNLRINFNWLCSESDTSHIDILILYIRYTAKTCYVLVFYVSPNYYLTTKYIMALRCIKSNKKSC